MVARLVRFAALLFAATILFGTFNYIRDRNAEVRDLRAETTMFRATAYAFTYATPTPTATATPTPRLTDDPYMKAVDAAAGKVQDLLDETYTIASDDDRAWADNARSLVIACQAARDPEPILPVWHDYDETLDRAMDLCVEMYTLMASAYRHKSASTWEDGRAMHAEFSATWESLGRLDPR